MAEPEVTCEGPANEPAAVISVWGRRRGRPAGDDGGYRAPKPASLTMTAAKKARPAPFGDEMLPGVDGSGPASVPAREAVRASATGGDKAAAAAAAAATADADSVAEACSFGPPAVEEPTAALSPRPRPVISAMRAGVAATCRGLKGCGAGRSSACFCASQAATAFRPSNWSDFLLGSKPHKHRRPPLRCMNQSTTPATNSNPTAAPTAAPISLPSTPRPTTGGKGGEGALTCCNTRAMSTKAGERLNACRVL